MPGGFVERPLTEGEYEKRQMDNFTRLFGIEPLPPREKTWREGLPRGYSSLPEGPMLMEPEARQRVIPLEQLRSPQQPPPQMGGFRGPASPEPMQGASGGAFSPPPDSVMRQLNEFLQRQNSFPPHQPGYQHPPGQPWPRRPSPME